MDNLLDMNLEILDDFINNKSKGDFLTKKQKDFLNSFKKLYNIDLFEFVDKWRTTKKLITISTYDISNNDLTNLERFCHDRRVRYEPNGHNALGIWV